MVKVEFHIELKEGYKKTSDPEPTKDMIVTIEAANYVTAKRMFNAMADMSKIEHCTSICVN